MNPKTNPLLAVALLGLGAYLYWQQQGGAAPTPAHPAPSARLQADLSQLRGLLKGHADAPRIAAAYAGAANILEWKKGEALATSGQLREYVASIGEYLANGQKLGPVGWGNEADLAFKRRFGLENEAIDRGGAVEFLRAMSWAAGG